ncbi:terminase small subunit [Serratia plymuthica]|uniref:terminase small subunit n=1 Tax=Serratia plymuthica TaxID=82996 RepID=UPI001F43B21C|nr:terminase small subunit [Serratia plymuthica]
MERGDVVDRQFCMLALLRIAGDIRSLLGGMPLSMRKRFPELESHHIEFLKCEIVKVMNKAEGLDELLPDLLEEYQRQSSV